MSQADLHLSKEQKSKAKAGVDFKKAIGEILDKLQKKKLIRNWGKAKSFGKVGYSYKDEHCPNFYVDTVDEKKIIIISSNSFRSCRRKIYYYDMEGVLQNPDYSNCLVSSIFLIGKSDKPFLDFRKRVKEKDRWCDTINMGKPQVDKTNVQMAKASLMERKGKY